MNYEINPFNRLLTNLLNELSRIRRQFGASHERIEEVTREEAMKGRQAVAAIWDEQARYHAELIQALDRISQQLAYGLNRDFEGEQ